METAPALWDFVPAIKQGIATMGQSVDYAGHSKRNKFEDDVIFSFIDGHVWMSRPGQEAVRVGSYEAAMAAMRDFLAQCELGERLANGAAQSRSTSTS